MARVPSVAECYSHDIAKRGLGVDGMSDTAADRFYMNWCEKKVNKWREACKEFGYDKPTHEIRTLTGSLTYHEWLAKEVGL